jgi:hypothetical protein
MEELIKQINDLDLRSDDAMQQIKVISNALASTSHIFSSEFANSEVDLYDKDYIDSLFVVENEGLKLMDSTSCYTMLNALKMLVAYYNDMRLENFMLRNQLKWKDNLARYSAQDAYVSEIPYNLQMYSFMLVRSDDGRSYRPVAYDKSAYNYLSIKYTKPRTFGGLIFQCVRYKEAFFSGNDLRQEQLDELLLKPPSPLPDSVQTQQRVRFNADEEQTINVFSKHTPARVMVPEDDYRTFIKFIKRLHNKF